MRKVVLPPHSGFEPWPQDVKLACTSALTTQPNWTFKIKKYNLTRSFIWYLCLAFGKTLRLSAIYFFFWIFILYFNPLSQILLIIKLNSRNIIIGFLVLFGYWGAPFLCIFSARGLSVFFYDVVWWKKVCCSSVVTLLPCKEFSRGGGRTSFST